MAQGELLADYHHDDENHIPVSLRELHQIRQCEKLIRFRDEVLSGSHPRIKPAHLAAKSKSRTPSAPNGTASTASAPAPAQPAKDIVNGAPPVAGSLPPSSASRCQQPPSQVAPSPDRQGHSSSASTNGGGPVGPTPARTFGVRSTAIDPILLQKSDDLIKAELQLQRGRIERTLKEQVEQRRASAKASLQAAEPLADFDLADVLSKALALVQSTAAQSTDDTAANASASTDSFDDNTFYSSRHDTPESPQLARVPHDSADGPMRDSSPYEPELDPPPPPAAHDQATQRSDINVSDQLHALSLLPQQSLSAAGHMPLPVPPQVPHPAVNAESNMEGSQSNPVRIPGLQIISAVQTPAGALRDGGTRLPEPTKNTEGDGVTSRGGPHYGDPQRPDFTQNQSTLIRAHNLSPIAPQPAHVSPLALQQPSAVQQPQPQPQSQPQSQQPLLLHQREHQDGDIRRATPAQVAALRRGNPSRGSSPDSSPQGSRAAEKKKPKKKKRKAERQGTEIAAHSPFIKAEPRSPSPLSAPAYARPAKRQRHEQRQQIEPDYDEPRYEQPVPADIGYREHGSREYAQTRGYREEQGGSVRYDRGGGDQGFYHDGPRPVVLAPSGVGPRYDREYYEDRHPTTPLPQRSSSSYPAGPYSAGSFPDGPYPGSSYAAGYGSDEVRVVHPISRVDVGAPYPGSPNPYREIHDGPHGGDRQTVAAPVERERPRSPVVYERPMSVMPPPRPAPGRIFIDEYGHEYIEPSRPAPIVRPSAASGSRAGDPDVVYERAAPPRGITRHPPFGEGGGIVYRRASPLPTHQRRVVTQPEFVGQPDYRAYRERDYSTRPAPAPSGDEYAPSRSYLENRVVAEPYRDFMPRPSSVRPSGDGVRYESTSGYERRLGPEVDRDRIARAPSTRPPEASRLEAPPPGYERRVADSREYLRAASVRPAEPVRYEVPREYAPRIGSVRPDVPNREYAASVRPDIRRDAIPPPPPPPPPPGEGRTYGAHTVEAADAPTIRQEYRIRPAEPLYERPVLRGDEEVIYVGPASHPEAYHHPVHRGH